jgi:hypothetical protein
MTYIDEISLALRKIYAHKVNVPFDVKEIDRSSYPPSANHGEHWQYMPTLPMVYDDLARDVAPLSPTITLRVETFQKDNGASIFRVWHGYCAENATVYFACWLFWSR